MSLLEPERIGTIDAEKRTRIPVVETLLRNVAQGHASDHRLRHSAHDADREELFGVDFEHALPDALAVLLRRGITPLAVELVQLDHLRDVGLHAHRAARLEVLPEFGPLQV